MLEFLEPKLDLVVVAYWYALTIFLVGTGLYITKKTRGIQFRRFGFMLLSCKTFLGQRSKDKSGIASIYTLMTILGTMIGSGNVLGVSVAIFLGGPGAVLWMWIISLINMAVSMTESTIGQYYKKRSTLEADKYIGGPAYYLEHGVGKKWLGIIFAIAISVNMIVFNGLQSHFLAGYMHRGFGLAHIWTGLGFATFFAIVIIGGVRRIAHAASIMVPIGAGIYLLVAIGIIIFNLDKVPAAFILIGRSALGYDQAGAGFAGYLFLRALNHGARRGLYSNEAGLGTLPCIAAASNAKHPTQEGFVSMLALFIDTIIVCTCTALVILTSGIDTTVDPATSEFGSGGSLLIDKALVTHLNVGMFPTYFMCFVLFFLAFTSLIGNYFVGESNQRYFKDNAIALRSYQILHILIIVYFAVSKSINVINVVDLVMGMAATCNLIGILYLSKKAFEIIANYEKQIDDGVEAPVLTEKRPLLD